MIGRREIFIDGVLPGPSRFPTSKGMPQAAGERDSTTRLCYNPATMIQKFKEVGEEFSTVALARTNILDAVLPPLAFIIINALAGFRAAMWSALALAVVFAGYRLARGRPVWYALGGLAGVLAAIAFTRLSGRAAGFFLPNIAVSGMTVLLALGSLILRRPLAAWTSHLVRRWPRAWYWHPRVRPAYAEVTWLWALYFGLRLGLQLQLFQTVSPGVLAAVNFALGWPGTTALLVASYLYGTWRLANLGGPSVEEFQNDDPPPWESQKRGF